MPESASRGRRLYLVPGGVWSGGVCYGGLVRGVCLVGGSAPRGVSDPRGVSAPRGDVSAPGGGVVSQHTLRQTPPREQNDRQV